MIYKLSQLLERISYEESRNKAISSTAKLHIGQLKLLYSEILFLTKYSADNDLVIYVGAAPGTHTAFLADMFPNLEFHLWDPGRFEIENRSNITEINKQFFNNEKASRYKNYSKNILFISDIRNLEISQSRKTNDMRKMNKIVTTDMNNQMDWVKIIRPKCAYLKFRLPFAEGYTPYLSGTIYLQPYSPESTEMRLLTHDYDNLVNYDNVEIEEKMAYFNCCMRNIGDKFYEYENIMEKYKIKNIWDNAYALAILDYYLRTIKKIESYDKVGELFMDIIKFHSEANPKKFKYLFED